MTLNNLPPIYFEMNWNEPDYNIIITPNDLSLQLWGLKTKQIMKDNFTSGEV